MAEKEKNVLGDITTIMKSIIPKIMSGKFSILDFVNEYLQGDKGDKLSQYVAGMLKNVPLEDGELECSITMSADGDHSKLNLVTWKKDGDNVVVARNLYEFPLQKVAVLFNEINKLKPEVKQVDFRKPEGEDSPPNVDDMGEELPHGPGINNTNVGTEEKRPEIPSETAPETTSETQQ